MAVLNALPASTPVGLPGHSSDMHPSLHQQYNTVVAAKATPGAVGFSNTDGDWSFDGTNFVFNNATDTLTVANLTVSGTLTGGGVSGLTPGAVTFGAADGSLTTDATGIFYNAATDQLRLGNGTATAPSYSFINSTGSGVFRAGADIVGVSTAGVQRIQVDADGMVQIGTTTPGAAWLRIGGGALHPDTTQTSLFGVDIDVIGRTTATAALTGFRSRIQTNTASYTLALAFGGRVLTPVVGAGSAITDMRGFVVENQGAAGITTAYGLRVNAQSGASQAYGAVVEAAGTQTLWVSSNADNTTAAAGIAFGSSRDTVLYRSAAATLSVTNQLSTGGAVGFGPVAVSTHQARVSVAYAGGSGGASDLVSGLTFPASTVNLGGGTGQTGSYFGVNLSSMTVTATTASVIPDLSGLKVQGPIPSTNVTATRSQAMLVQTGANANFGVAIRQNSGSQTGPLLALQDSAGTNISVIDATGRFRGPDGTAAFPGFHFLTDTDIGMYRAAADALGFSTAGTERARILADGAVGIGIATSGSSWVSIGGGNTHPATTTTLQGLDVDFTSPATATGVHAGIRAKVRTTAAAYTASTVRTIFVEAPTLGAGSAISLNRGIQVSNQGASGVGIAHGIHVSAQSGAGTASYGVTIEAATTRTLWLSSNADNTTTAAGIWFGLSQDTVAYRKGAGILGVSSIVDAATEFRVAATKVVGAQAAAVADASGGAIIDAEARTALNDLLAKLRTHGLIAT